MCFAKVNKLFAGSSSLSHHLLRHLVSQLQRNNPFFAYWTSKGSTRKAFELIISNFLQNLVLHSNGGLSLLFGFACMLQLLLQFFGSSLLANSNSICCCCFGFLNSSDSKAKTNYWLTSVFSSNLEQQIFHPKQPVNVR